MARTIQLRREDLTRRAREALTSANPASWRATPGLADWARPSHWATRIEPLPPGLENLWQVAPGLYRCGQPTAEGFRSLQALGIGTVVSLRQTVSDLPLAAGSGVAVVRIPMKSRFVAEDRGARVVRAMRAVRAGMEAGAVAVHCRHGSDRTGLIMALWRILYQGWTRQQALDELIAGGYGYHPIWANIPRYLRKVDLKDLRARIEGLGVGMAEDDWLDWQAARRAALEAEDGWLNLTDRLDLPPGPQRVGRGAGNDLILSAGPDHLGVVEVTGLGAARFTHPDGGVEPFRPGAGGFPVLRVPPLLLELHTVDGVPALRVRDLTLPRRASLRLYPHDPAWRIEAVWEELAMAEPLSIGQKGAGETVVSLTHRAHFQVAGRDVTLLPTHRKSGAPMFVIRDATSGAETYAASRFLIGEVRGDRVILDFNRAHNPPCAFTDFAICPLPPAENRLPFPVRAGELKP